MKPYYEAARIVIYHGDCRELLADESVRADLLLTDPPYGIGVSRKTFGAGRVNNGSGIRQRSRRVCKPKKFPKSDWDDHPAPTDLINLARSRARWAVIWGGNYFELPPSMRWLVWDKRNDGNTFSDCELAWTSERKCVRIFRHMWNGMLQEHNGKLKEPKLHPSMKPLPLMKWCISLFPEAKSVLDPWMGSGTTLVAAKNAGLSAIGCELDEHYCEVAAERLSQEVFDFWDARVEELPVELCLPGLDG